MKLYRCQHLLMQFFMLLFKVLKVIEVKESFEN